VNDANPCLAIKRADGSMKYVPIEDTNALFKSLKVSGLAGVGVRNLLVDANGNVTVGSLSDNPSKGDNTLNISNGEGGWEDTAVSILDSDSTSLISTTKDDIRFDKKVVVQAEDRPVAPFVRIEPTEVHIGDTGYNLTGAHKVSLTKHQVAISYWAQHLENIYSDTYTHIDRDRIAWANVGNHNFDTENYDYEILPRHQALQFTANGEIVVAIDPEGRIQHADAVSDNQSVALGQLKSILGLPATPRAIMRADSAGAELEDSGLTIVDGEDSKTIKSNATNLIVQDGQNLNHINFGSGDGGRNIDMAAMRTFRLLFGMEAGGAPDFNVESPYTCEFLWDTIGKVALSLKVKSNSSGHITDTYLDVPNGMSIRDTNGQSRLIITNEGIVDLPTHTNNRNQSDRVVTSSAFGDPNFQFNSGRGGVVPMSGGGTDNFLRADGTWATPSEPASALRVVATGQQFLDALADPNIRHIFVANNPESDMLTVKANVLTIGTKYEVNVYGNSIKFLPASGSTLSIIGSSSEDYYRLIFRSPDVIFAGTSTLNINGGGVLTRVTTALVPMVVTASVVDPDRQLFYEASLHSEPITGAAKRSYWDNTFAGIMTSVGDIMYLNTDGLPTRLPKGTNGQVLTQGASVPSWATPSGGSGGGVTTTFRFATVETQALYSPLIIPPTDTAWTDVIGYACPNGCKIVSLGFLVSTYTTNNLSSITVSARILPMNSTTPTHWNDGGGATIYSTTLDVPNTSGTPRRLAGKHDKGVNISVPSGSMLYLKITSNGPFQAISGITATVTIQED
jgi:hypothetical protein